MDITYFEKRLAVSIALMNAATDPGARRAHRGMVDGYRALARGMPKKVAPPWPERDIRDALDSWANDGGPCREFGS
jgi:hypothetical protein